MAFLRRVASGRYFRTILGVSVLSLIAFSMFGGSFGGAPGTIVTLLLAASVAMNVWGLKRKKQSVHWILMQEMKHVRELATLRHTFQSVIQHKKAKPLVTPLGEITLPGTERRFIMTYSGTTTCGCDLSKAQISERFAVNRVHITLPHSKVLDVVPDMKSVEVYDEKVGIFARAAIVSDFVEEIGKDLDKQRAKLMESDIVHRADEQARIALISLAAAVGMEAEVTFTDVKGIEETEEAAGLAAEPEIAVLPDVELELISVPAALEPDLSQGRAPGPISPTGV